MSTDSGLGGPWRFGPVTVWCLPHVNGTRGEPQARVLLAGQLGTDPDTLPLQRDPRGRPELHAAFAHLGTGWSHSHGRLLVALGEGVRLGVDLEPLRPRPRMREIIERFFHPGEVDWLLGLDEDACQRWFFRVWCAKEAILKAQGQGISFGLHRLQLAPAPDAALHLAWCDPELGDAARWHLHEWAAGDDFRAALAWHAV